MKLRGNYLIKKSKERPDIYIQNYSATSSFVPTQNISLLGTIRYSKIHQSTKESQNITPTGTININNDIFNLNISGTLSETHDTVRNDLFSSSYNINFSSFYKKIVNLNLTYTNSSTHDDYSSGILNFSTQNYGITLKRNFFKVISLYYDFKKDIFKNKIEHNKVLTYNDTIITSLGSINFNISKLKFNFSSNFSYKRNRIKSNTNQSGYAKFPVPVEVLWTPPIEDTGQLRKDQKIIIKIPTNGIDLIYFYTDSTYMILISNNVKWDVYWSDDGKENSWKLIDSSISFPYNISNSNFNKDGYLKFEISSYPNNEIELNSPFIECYVLRKTEKNYAELTTHSRSFASNLGIQYKFSKKISSSYNFNLSINNPSGGKETDNIYQTLSTYFNLNKYFNSSFIISNNYRIVQDSPDTSTLSFSFSNYSEILDTLSNSFTYSKSINKQNGKKLNSTDSLTLSINASIYPDLTAKLTNSFSYSKSYIGNSITRNISSLLNLTARFTQALTYTAGYSFTKSISKNSSTSQKIQSNLSWRVSDKMFINISESINLQKKVTQYSHNFTLWMEVTKKIQYNFSYSGIRGNLNSNSFSNYLSWKIGKNISAKVNYNTQISKGERKWSATIGLNFSF